MDLESKTLAELREMAKEKGIEKYSSMRKADLIRKLTKTDAADRKTGSGETGKVPAAEADRSSSGQKTGRSSSSDSQAGVVRESHANGNRENRGPAKHESREPVRQERGQQKSRYHDGSDGVITIARERSIEDVPPTSLGALDSGVTKEGILEIMPEGFGFIRCDNYLPGENDVYVSPQFIRKFGLRTGDIISGNLRMRTQNEKFSALLYMKKVNGRSPGYLYDREKFENLTPIFPNQRIHLETPGTGMSMRMLDLIAPIGKGQRGMIVSQPKTGKTTLLKQVAKAVTRNHPDMKMIILLIDERPEEVTDIKESIEGAQV